MNSTSPSIWESVVLTDTQNRLDQYLTQALPQFSRSALQKMIENQKVQINQKIITKSKTRVHLGDQLRLELPNLSEKKPVAENIPLDILYEDEILAVLNKPPGMVVHQGHHCDAKILVNALLHHLNSLSDIDPERPGIVHRLDLETSGVLIVAKTNTAHQHLAQQFAERTVQKQYLALVRGTPLNAHWVVDRPLGRNPKNPTRRCVLEYGKPAYTEFETLQKFEKGYTLLRAFPKTGRTHQIRVHLQFVGFPLVGEKIYNKDPEPILSHHALHAEKIIFAHPSSSEKMEFCAPLPSDFQALLKTL